MAGIDDKENEARMARGELYYAFTPELTAKRNRCHHACHRFNLAGEVPRRKHVELWRDIIDDKRPLPPPGASEEEDATLLSDEVYVEGPINVDYGTNLRYSQRNKNSASRIFTFIGSVPASLSISMQPSLIHV